MKVLGDILCERCVHYNAKYIYIKKKSAGSDETQAQTLASVTVIHNSLLNLDKVKHIITLRIKTNMKLNMLYKIKGNWYYTILYYTII